jgi:hypothetical protein
LDIHKIRRICKAKWAMIHPLVEDDDGGPAGCFFTALKIHKTPNKYYFSNALT